MLQNCAKVRNFVKKVYYNICNILLLTVYNCSPPNTISHIYPHNKLPYWCPKEATDFVDDGIVR